LSDVGIGHLRGKSGRFDLASLIEDIAQSIAGQTDTKDLEIISFIDPSTPENVVGDSDCLYQVLMSLAGYAVKFADHEWISIHAKVENETKAFTVVIFSLSFVGTAAFGDHQQAIRECLEEDDESIFLELGGINSDLCKAQQLVKRMGSRIRVIYYPEQESKFIFSIKFIRDSLSKASKPAIEFSGVQILLVDDNLHSQQALTKMLHAMGCRVKAVASGAEVHPAVVRGLISNTPFRVVLLDTEIPDMDGESVLRVLRQDDMTKNTKVIFLAPIGHREKLNRVSDPTNSNCLFKPVRRSALREVLESTLGLLPVIHRENNPMKTEEAAETREVRNLKVLLVEDDELNLQMSTILLGRLGCTVDFAYNGAEAVAAVETREYDMVFMDVQMPVMSGLEATHRIRALKNDRKNVPIFAVTAHADTQYEQSCLEAGMDGYISKPFDIEHISQIISACATGHYRKRLASKATGETKSQPVDFPMLDVAMAMLIFDNDATRYDKFLREFLGGLPKRFEKMVNALKAEDWRVLGNEAHNLKGISANLGAMLISNLASQLEAQSREGIEKPVNSTLYEIEDAITELVDHYPNIVSMNKSIKKEHSR